MAIRLRYAERRLPTVMFWQTKQYQLPTSIQFKNADFMAEATTLRRGGRLYAGA